MAVSILNQKTVSEGLIYAEIFCTSLDTMPTDGLVTGSKCLVIDTGKEYYFDSDSGAWFEKGGSAPTMTITFDMQGFGTQVEAVTTSWNTAASAPANPSEDGYTFGGWYKDAECKTAYVWTDKVTHNITLYAKWTIIEYTITYNLDGGTNDPDNPAKFTVETPDITLKDATKADYTFGGWYGAADFSGDAVTKIAKGSHANVALYAKFEAVSEGE